MNRAIALGPDEDARTNQLARTMQSVGSFCIVVGIVAACWGVVVLLGPSIWLGLLHLAGGVAQVVLGAWLRGSSDALFRLSLGEGHETPEGELLMRAFALLRRYVLLQAALLLVAVILAGLAALVLALTLGAGKLAAVVISCTAVFVVALLRLATVRRTGTV